MDYLKEDSNPDKIVLTDELDDVVILKETAGLILDYIRGDEKGEIVSLTMPDATQLELEFLDRGSLNIDVYFDPTHSEASLVMMWFASEVDQLEEELAELLGK